MTRTEVVTVPAEQVGDIRATLLTLRDVELDSLAGAVDEYLAGDERVETLRDRMRELHRLGDWLDALDANAPVELYGPPGLLREVLYDALVSAVEELAHACHEYEAGGADLDLVREKRRAADVFAGLFIDFEWRDRIDPPA